MQVHTKKNILFQDMATVKQMFQKCPPTDEQMQKLYRLLHEVKLLFT